jgi:hypothetical protein
MGQLGLQGRKEADGPYELLIVHSGHDEYKWDNGEKRREKVER